MADVLYIQIKTRELAGFAERIEAWAKDALREAIRPVHGRIVALTPRWTGGLAQSIATREEEGGRVQTVRAQGVVALVHERNAQWSRPPPWQPIAEWVQGKLGYTPESPGLRKAMKERARERAYFEAGLPPLRGRLAPGRTRETVGAARERVARGGPTFGQIVGAIRRKILRRGLTLPNREGKGQMFARAYEHFRSTREHFHAFRMALRQRIQGG